MYVKNTVTFGLLAHHCISGTSEQKIMKIKSSHTFSKRNCLMKKNWPLKARKAMLKTP